MATKRKLKINMFLSFDEQTDVNGFIEDLESKEYETNDYIESGGLGVRKEITSEGNFYEVYRIIGDVFIKNTKETSKNRKK